MITHYHHLLTSAWGTVYFHPEKPFEPFLTWSTIPQAKSSPKPPSLLEWVRCLATPGILVISKPMLNNVIVFITLYSICLLFRDHLWGKYSILHVRLVAIHKDLRVKELSFISQLHYSVTLKIIELLCVMKGDNIATVGSTW